MTTPRISRDPTTEKRNALGLATYAAEKADATERQRNAAILFAKRSGASLREIAEATGLPHTTVKRIVDREATKTSN